MESRFGPADRGADPGARGVVRWAAGWVARVAGDGLRVARVGLRAVGVVALAAGTVLLLVRATDGGANLAIILLVALSPWSTPAAAVGAAASLLGGRPRVAMVGALILALSVVTWSGGGPSTARASATTGDVVPLRIISANIGVGGADVATLASLVREYRPDVLALIELTPAAWDALQGSEILAALPHAFTDPRGGSEGTGILSAAPLVEARSIPGTAFATLAATVVVEGTVIQVVAAHPAPPMFSGAWQQDHAVLLAALQAAAVAGVPQVIAGDFNATTDHAPFQSLLEAGYHDMRSPGALPWDDATWPTIGPLPALLRIDHILASGGITATAVTAVSIAGTDHRALIAELAVPDRKP